MHLYIQIMGLQLPSYGLLIATGVVIANFVSYLILRKTKQDGNDFIILEAYGILGGFIGAKVLYLIVSRNQIDWNRITDITYANQLMLSGFVFYGGLIGGILFIFLAGKIHKIPALEYIRNFILLFRLFIALAGLDVLWQGAVTENHMMDRLQLFSRRIPMHCRV